MNPQTNIISPIPRRGTTTTDATPHNYASAVHSQSAQYPPSPPPYPPNPPPSPVHGVDGRFIIRLDDGLRVGGWCQRGRIWGVVRCMYAFTAFWVEGLFWQCRWLEYVNEIEMILYQLLYPWEPWDLGVSTFNVWLDSSFVISDS